MLRNMNFKLIAIYGVLFALMATMVESKDLSSRSTDMMTSKNEEKACPKDKITAKIIAAWKTFNDSKAKNGGEELLNALDEAKLPVGCFKKFAMCESGSFAVEDAKTFICGVKEEYKKMTVTPIFFPVMHCAATNKMEFCKMPKTLNCHDKKMDKRVFQILKEEFGCDYDISDLDDLDIFKLKKEEFERILKNETMLGKLFEKITSSIIEMGLKPEKAMEALKHFSKIPCEIKFKLADIIIMKYPKMTEEKAKISAALFLPFATKDFCSKQLTEIDIKNLIKMGLGNLNFQCGPPNEKSNTGPMKKQDGFKFPKAPFTKNICDRGCGKAIMKRVIDFSDFNTTYSDKLGDLQKCAKAKDMVKNLPCKDVDPNNFNKKDLKKLFDKCKQNMKPEDLDMDKIMAIGKSIIAIPIGHFRKINKDIICKKEVLDHLQKIFSEFPKESKIFEKHILNLCFGERKEFTSEHLKQIGNAIFNADPETLMKTDKAILKENIGLLKNAAKYGNPGAIKAFINKFNMPEDVDNVLDMIKSRKLAENFDVDTFKKSVDLSKSEVLDKIKDQEITTKNLKRFAASKLLEKYPAKDMDADKVKKYIKLLFGVDSNILENLNKDTFSETLYNLCAESSWTCKQAQAIKGFLLNYLKTLNSEEPVSAFEPYDAENLNPVCVAMFSKMEISMMQNKTKIAICKKIGSFDKLNCCLRQTAIKDISKDCSMYLDENNDNKLDDDEADDMGNLLMGDESIIDKVDKDTIDSKVRKFRGKCMPKNIRNKIVKKLKEKIGSKDFTEDDISKYGSFLAQFSDSQSEKITESIVGQIDELTSDISYDMDSMAEEDDMMCCYHAMGKEEKEAMKEYKDKIKNFLKEKVQKDSQTNARKRRATTPSTCSDLQTMGSGVDKLSVAEIEAISQTEFDNCLDFLGSTARVWSKDQLMALVKKLGKVCDKQKDDQVRIGILAYGLTVEDLSCLDLTYDSIVKQLGELSDFEESKLMKLMEKYLEKNKVTDVSTLTTIHLTTLGHLVCGLSADQIGKLNKMEFKKTTSIGQLTNCMSSGLKAFAKLAKSNEVYGPVSKWDNSIHAQVGIMIGGLDASDMKDVKGGHIESWSVNGIAKMPGSVLKELKTDQLKYFSQQQSISISAEARKEMSNEQLKTLGLPENSGSNNPNDSTKVISSAILLFVSVILVEFSRP